ncbi:MAG: DUF1330 domain-containing protein [Lentisphaeria bacterium]|nr:DUF1330 domain-containing protein [Lentisphaeria bacterium]
MSFYVIAELAPSNEDWIPAYLENVTRLVKEHGGHYLARTPKVEKIEGDRDAPPLIAIIEFPSEDAAKAFYTCEEYQPYLESRKAGCKTQLMLIAGEDIAEG